MPSPSNTPPRRTARGRTASLVALLVAVACGGRTSEGDPSRPTRIWTSGSRLRARVHDAGAGAVRFVAWHDTQIDVDCTFMTAEDGALRCLPNVDVDVIDGLFADPQCTTEAIEHASTCAAEPRLVRAGVRTPAGGIDTCDYRLRVLELTKAAGTYRRVNGVCTAQAPSNENVYAAKPVDVARFTRGELRTEPRTSRVAASVVVSEDGARQTTGLVDVQRNAPCLLSAVDPHCLPFVEGAEAVTDGASCAVDAVVASCAAKPPSTFVDFTNDPSDECRTKVRVRALGAGQLRTYFNPSYGGPCTPAPAPGMVLPLGADIALDTFPSMGEVTAGEGRVRLAYVASEGKGLVEGTFRDEKVPGECAPQRDANGALRCMPSVFFGSRRRWSDPACTVRVLPIFGPDTCDAKGRTYVSGSTYEDAALCRDELFVLGNRVDARAYERDEKTGACVASETVRAYFELTTKSPDVLAPITERVE